MGKERERVNKNVNNNKKVERNLIGRNALMVRQKYKNTY